MGLVRDDPTSRRSARREGRVSRAHINLKTKLASALCQMVRYDEEQAAFVRIIPHEQAKTLTEDQILARFEFHHDPIPKAHDGPDVHWNLTPLPKAKHREITAKIDIPRIAKGKRLSKQQNAFRRRLLARSEGEALPASRWPKRKLQSRGFEQRR